ncbi:hypothetical protein MNEG_6359, partial [Monoraphidium neglectum]
TAPLKGSGPASGPPCLQLHAAPAPPRRHPRRRPRRGRPGAAPPSQRWAPGPRLPSSCGSAGNSWLRTAAAAAAGAGHLRPPTAQEHLKCLHHHLAGVSTRGVAAAAAAVPVELADAPLIGKLQAAEVQRIRTCREHSRKRRRQRLACGRRAPRARGGACARPPSGRSWRACGRSRSRKGGRASRAAARE